MPFMVIALGSNQHSVVGLPQVTLEKAFQRLEERGGMIRKMSRFYNTPCFPAGAGPDYVNAVLLMDAPWEPIETLTHLHVIEQEFGRERIQRWGQRTIDLDLIAVQNTIAPDLKTFEEWRDLAPDLQKIQAPKELILPHPRLQDRAFVLIPMRDVAPDWMHPVSGLTVIEMLNALPEAEKAEVIALKGRDNALVSESKVQ